MNPTPLHGYPALKVSMLLIVGILVGTAMQLSLAVLVLFLILVLLAVSIPPRRSGPRPRQNTLSVLLLPLLVLVIGATKITSDRFFLPPVPERFLNHPVAVRGKVVETPSHLKNRMRFVLQGVTLDDSGRVSQLPLNMLVTVSRWRTDSIDVDVRYGEWLIARGELARPPLQRNPGEFNAREYYEANGITLFLIARGYASVAIDTLAGGNATRSWYEWCMATIVEPARLYIRQVVDTTVGGEEGEFLKGIIVGDRTGMSAATRQAFVNSGVAHILAVSGSNVALIAAILVFVCRLPRLSRWVEAVVTVCGLLFYMVLTGNQPPVVRATVMALVFLGAMWLQVKANPLNSLGVAAIVILMFDARQLFDVGFQLSFAAVFSIVNLHPKVDVHIKSLRGNGWARQVLVDVLRLCALTAVATLGTLPLTAIHFGKVSVIGLIANVFVVPMAGWSLILGMVSILSGVVSFPVAEAFSAVNKLILWLALKIATTAGNVPFAYIETLRFSWVETLPYCAFLAAAFHWTRKSVVRVSLLMMLAGLNLCVYLPRAPAYSSTPSNLRISFIDVGQGDAALVEFPDGKTMLVDSGPRSEGYDTGERIIAPFLKRRNILRIDLLVLSHPHDDHIGGAPALLNTFAVGRVIVTGQADTVPAYREIMQRVASGCIPVDTVRAGESITGMIGVRLYVLSPIESYVEKDTTHIHPHLNLTSIVLKLAFGEISVLLAGDADCDAEAGMVQRYGSFLHSSLLKVGHHGSTSSSSPGFLDLVKPSGAVISVGRNNRFRHPSREVLKRLSDENVEVSRTDEEGAVVFETDGKKLRRVDWR